MLPLAFSLLTRLGLAEPPAFAGLALADLPGLGLGEPTLFDGTDRWRAPVVGGGWVLHQWSADEAAARGDAAFARASVQRALPAAAVAGADEAWGDEGFVIVRRANVVIQVRAAGATALAAKLLATETPASAVAAAAGPTPDRDAFGRRRSDAGR
jgi:hypothetical protein